MANWKIKVTRPTFDWGAAHEEASPVRLEHDGRCVEVYLTERYDMVITLPENARIEMIRGELKVTIPQGY